MTSGIDEQVVVTFAGVNRNAGYIIDHCSGCDRFKIYDCTPGTMSESIQDRELPRHFCFTCTIACGGVTITEDILGICKAALLKQTMEGRR